MDSAAIWSIYERSMWRIDRLMREGHRFHLLLQSVFVHHSLYNRKKRAINNKILHRLLTARYILGYLRAYYEAGRECNQVVRGIQAGSGFFSASKPSAW